MMTLEERAKSYAMQVGCFRPDLCAADYIAGAKEERMLIIEEVCEWLENHIDLEHDYPSSKEELLEDFRKAMAK